MSAPRAAPDSGAAFPVVGVGASAGGMEAFTQLLRELPPDTGMAWVLVQHLDPSHPSYLSEALGRATGREVHEIREGMRLEPDLVYVIPSDADVGILKGQLVLVPRPASRRDPHLPVDFFFEALAADQGSLALGVVLSGTGADGAQGIRAIKAEGGITFAQAPASAKFSGMPEAAIRTGAVDFTLPIPDLARELVRMGRHPFVTSRGPEAPATPAEESDLRRLLMLLRGATGVDFSEYKLTSIRRRLGRRMALNRVSTLPEYTRLIQEDPAEARALFEDVFIHVTSFFRDAAAFDTLKALAFPELLKRKRDGNTIRIWCAGCSSGEEAYSLLISLLEFLSEQDATHVPVQLFGTDISEKAIEKARRGFYSDAATAGLSPERLARYFTRADGGGYTVNATVRERCAFVRHNLANDPPFSRIDLVSCRNVLIYFGQALQARALSAFQFALGEPGYLLLGPSENVVDGSGAFYPVDKKTRIFARTAARSTLRLAPGRGATSLPPQVSPARPGLTPTADAVRRLEGLLLDQYAPPGVVVNDRMEVLHFRGRTGAFLEPAPGTPHHDVLKMARKGLMADLRIALSQAKKSGGRAERPGVRVEEDGFERRVDLVVVPLAARPESAEATFAVLFVPPEAPEGEAPLRKAPASRRRADSKSAARLERELAATKEHLESIIEEHRRTNAELLASNDELVSSNEELQSLNEELETAKEELQSTNEELSTLNEELQARNTELNLVNADLVNVLGSVEVPIVIVDAYRRIRRFTPSARPLLNLLPADIGRPLDEIRTALGVEGLDRKIAEVVEKVTVYEEEIRGREGRWYRLQVRPYMTLDKRIDGAVLTVMDIDALKRALSAAEWVRDYSRATVEAVQTPLVVLDEKLEVISANEAFLRQFVTERGRTEGQSVFALLEGALDVTEVRAKLRGVLETHQPFQGLLVERTVPIRGRRHLSLSGRIVPTPGGSQMVLLAAEDVTDLLRRENERARLLEETRAARAGAEDANRSKDLFLATLSHELRTPLSNLLLQAQLMRRGKMDEARIQRASLAIEQATRAQAQLVDDLLDISRIVTGKLKMERREVGVPAVVKAAAEVVAPTAERKGLEVALRVDGGHLAVWGDPARLQQAVLNLLTNAIKFTPEGGRITVTVDMLQDRVRVQVSDTGIGIDPDFLPHVFSRFRQEDQGDTRGFGGLGLGLGIVRYMVEAHGGEVQAESKGRGKGTTFTLLLPLMPAERRERSGHVVDGCDLAVPQPSGDIRGVRVLVVEDDPGTREALAEMLQQSGASVQTAGSAQEGMAAFRAFGPQVIVSDVAMPGEDGCSLLRRIRAVGPAEGGDVPALALSALVGEENRRQTAAAGFQLHLTKPVGIEELTAALAGLVRAERRSARTREPTT